MEKSTSITSRRDFMMKSAMAASAAFFPFNSSGNSATNQKQSNKKSVPEGKICAFSKLFQFLNYDQLAEVFAASGLDGIDLTVRTGGHVEPANVKNDLPKAVKAAKKSGIEVLMLTTEITDPDKQASIDLLKIAADQGVKYYRSGYINYDSSISVIENMENTRRIFNRLAEINEKTGVHGAYQNHHQKPRIGSPVWDLWYILKDIDPKWFSCQFDIWHAVIEGYSSWWHGLSLLAPHIKTRCVKDFTWITGRNGKLRPEPVPLGEGQIDFDAYFQLLKSLDVEGDTSLHIEFPVLTEAENNLPIKNKMEKAIQVLKKDTDKLKDYIAKNR